MKTQKAQVDITYLIVSVFAVILVLALADTIWSAFNSNASFQALTQATPQGKLAVANVTTSLNIFNNAIVLLFVMSCIASVIAAAFVNSSIIFAVPAIVVLPINIFFSFIFHDVFFQIVTGSAIGAALNSYPLTITLFQYLPVMTLGFSVLLVVVLFTKPE